ncbi:MAG: PIN domain-containing protein [Terriglobia bacterium]
MILVDTSVWVDFLNSARSPAGDELERLIGLNAPVVLTGLILTEVLHGLKLVNGWLDLLRAASR